MNSNSWQSYLFPLFIFLTLLHGATGATDRWHVWEKFCSWVRCIAPCFLVQSFGGGFKVAVCPVLPIKPVDCILGNDLANFFGEDTGQMCQSTVIVLVFVSCLVNQTRWFSLLFSGPVLSWGSLLKNKWLSVSIRCIKCIPNHPGSQMALEHFHQTLKSKLTKYRCDAWKDWGMIFPYLFCSPRCSTRVFLFQSWRSAPP